MESIYKKIGERIRFLRQQMKMSQEALGKDIHMSRQTIGQYESAVRRIPLHHLQAIEEVLGKPIYLYQEKAPAAEPLTEKMIPLLNMVSYCRYLPVTAARSSKKGFLPMQMHTKNMLPFPEELVQGVDYIYAGGTNEKLNLYFISRDAVPGPGDLVITENPAMDDADHRVGVDYCIDSYDEIQADRQTCMQIGTGDNYPEEEQGRDKVIGVVKAAMQIGGFGPLQTVTRLQILPREGS